VLPGNGHKGDINCVKITSDGALVASAGKPVPKIVNIKAYIHSGMDRRIIISDLRNGSLLFELPLPAQCANALAWLGEGANGRHLAAGCDDGSLIVWSLSRDHRHSCRLVQKYPSEVVLLQYDLAANLMLAAFDHFCILFDLEGENDPQYDADTSFDCRSDIGGIGFLNSGSSCIASAPGLSKL
jgi:WD40 repeat protein